MRQNAAAAAKAAERRGLKDFEEGLDEMHRSRDPPKELVTEGSTADATVLVDEIYESDVLYVTRWA